MNEPIAVNERTKAALRQLFEQSRRLQDALSTYVEAVGAALDVPRDWRFDTQTMAFLPPPTNLAEADPGEPAPPNDTVEE